MFKIHPTLGIFQITFGDVTLSAGLSWGHYCEARHKPETQGKFESEDVEVGLMHAETKDWMTKEIWLQCFGRELGDDVVGWVTPTQFANLVQFLNERAKK